MYEVALGLKTQEDIGLPLRTDAAPTFFSITSGLQTLVDSRITLDNMSPS
jgi:hypothetical protein